SLRCRCCGACGQIAGTMPSRSDRYIRACRFRDGPCAESSAQSLCDAAWRRVLAVAQDFSLDRDADPFMLHLYAALAEKERRLISDRTKAALAASSAIRATPQVPARSAGERKPRPLTSSLPSYPAGARD